MNFRRALVDAGWKLAQCCVWVKQTLVMGRQDYHWQHEPILYGWKPGASHRWFTDRKQTTVWNFDKPSRSTDHPTMKPVDLISYPILNSSRNADVVLDTFGGAGSTLIACAKHGREARLLEIDPLYCDVIIRTLAGVERGEGSERRKPILRGSLIGPVGGEGCVKLLQVSYVPGGGDQSSVEPARPDLVLPGAKAGVSCRLRDVSGDCEDLPWPSRNPRRGVLA